MASGEYSVLTPERVNLQYDIAGIGSRGAAAIIDTSIQAVTLVVVFVGLTAGLSLIDGGVGDGLGALLVGLFALALFAIADGYFMLFEILWNGQTPGKRLVGLRVIRENGYPMRPIDAVIRNLVRIVDWLPAAYGIGVLTMLVEQTLEASGRFCQRDYRRARRWRGRSFDPDASRVRAARRAAVQYRCNPGPRFSGPTVDHGPHAACRPRRAPERGSGTPLFADPRWRS